ncbi:MAG: hypothetical protein F4020_03595 [Gammaproteobacteria bacterium]|nr:hypothetical protein [Gammaproteobacteria bacterium]MYK68658.1 hypothetical protein [Gammaproteobacteria bacterium]
MQPVLAPEIRDGDILAVHVADGAGFYRYDHAGDLLHPGSPEAAAIPAMRLEAMAVAGRVTACLRQVGDAPGPDASGDTPSGRRWRRGSRRIADVREGRGRRGPRHR